MKITPELLKELGFVQQKNKHGIEIDEWVLKMIYLFTIKGGPDTYRYYSPCSLEPHYHMVTDIEEVFAFAYEDAYESGKRAAKQELKDWINGSD